MDAPTQNLANAWTIWIHIPYDQNWSLDSYTEICTFRTVNELVYLTKIMEDLVKVCMVFVMKEGVNPMWEDKRNIAGGGFSYKIQNEYVTASWRTIMFSTIGCTITNSELLDKITGITVSPKKCFHIIKLWVSDEFPASELNVSAHDMASESTLYKTHIDRR